MEITPISLSVLMTREEYMQFTVQLYRKQRNGLSFFTVAGGILAIVSLAGLFFGQYISLSPFSAGCLLLFGLFLLCYEGAIAPIFCKGAAAREYEEKEELRTANVYIFTPTAVQVRNSRMEGNLPLSLATGWTKTAGGLQISFGRECHIHIPARLLSEKQAKDIVGWLEKNTVSKT